MRASKSSLKLLVAVIALAGLWLGVPHIGKLFHPDTPSQTSATADKSIHAAAGSPAAQATQSAQVDQHPKRVEIDPATLPADTVWTLRDGKSSSRTYVIALDELYIPAGPQKQRMHSLPSQPNLAALLSAAHGLTVQTGTQPQLVLYPLNGPRDESSRRIVTTKVHIETTDLEAVKTASASFGITAWQTPSYAPGHAIAQVSGDPSEALRVAALLAKLPQVSYAAPLLAKKLAPAAAPLPTDPFFSKQWHLLNTGQQNGTPGIDINVVPVWPTLKGTGIGIAIVDTGLQLDHPDLVANISTTDNYDWIDGDDNPSPDPTIEADFHGTSVAGLAAASSNNGIGVVGAAPEATLYGLRLIGGNNNDQDYADAMAWWSHNNNIEIENNSWGPAADDTGLGDPGTLWQAAATNGTATGRGGLGTIYVFAAGNGKDSGAQGNKNGYANNINVIAVSALTNTGASTYYSEGGAHIIVSAPGGEPAPAAGITTTDLTGIDGYNTTATAGGADLNDDDYTKTFDGTSAATPIVSGVVALMLEANPLLGWRDVQEILLRSSTKIQPNDAGWVTRDGGQPGLPLIKQHTYFGGGLVNAKAATDLATTWTPLGTESVLTASNSPVNPITIPDAGAAISIPFDFGPGAAVRVEHVELTINITHQYRGDLEIKLTSPSGVVSTLAKPTKLDDGADYPDWTFSSVRHWGELSTGTWTLSIRDAAGGDVGKFVSATLKVHGVVRLPPAVSLSTPGSFHTSLGSPVLFPLTTDHGPYFYRYIGLPKGLAYNSTTAEITGRTTAAGTFPVILLTTDPYGLFTVLYINLVIDPLPAAFVGVFNGTVDRDPALNQNLGGALSFTTTPGGLLTGRLTLGATTYTLTGGLDSTPGADATATLTIPRKGLPPLSLHLTLPLDDSGATGTLNSTVGVAAWHKASTTPTYTGNYTFALETPAGSGWPAGYSTGTIGVSTAGAVTWTLQPADGTAAIKGSTTLSTDGILPLFAPATTPAGSFLGFFSLPVNSMPASSITGSVSWLRAATTSALYANSAGFGPLSMTLHGGRYTPPASLVLGLPVVANNASLQFGGTDVDLGSKASSLASFTFTLASQNKVVLPAVNPTALKLTINAATGTFSGTFSLTDPSLTKPGSTVTRSEKFSGVILPQSDLGAGFFVLPPIPGSINGTRSGSVIFSQSH